MSQPRKPETWTRDPQDPDLWHGAHGVIVNTAALCEREVYYRVRRRTRRPRQAPQPEQEARV